MTTTERSFATEFEAACVADRTPGATLAERSVAQTTMEEIIESAFDAGQEIDFMGIDERVRLAIYA